jgi:hypothetical protein
VAHGDYEKLTPEAIDELWVRLWSGKAAKPAARELDLGDHHGSGVSAALWWDQA